MSLTDTPAAAVAVEAPDNAPSSPAVFNDSAGVTHESAEMTVTTTTSPDVLETVTPTDDEIMAQAMANAAAITGQRDTPPPVESATTHIETETHTVDDRGRAI